VRTLRSFSLLLLILGVTIVALAQSTNATISGVIVDPSGKVIPGATIEILNDATGMRYSGETNDAGIYVVSILPPGQYRVLVSKLGFKTLIKPGVTLNVQSAVALNFTLPLGATSESVTVNAGTSPINTTDASVSTVIDHKFIENLPLNGRSFQDLISMTPGVTTQSPQSGSGPSYIGAIGDFSVNGQRTESNNYSVDGVTANVGSGNGYGVTGAAVGGAVASSTALGTTQSLVSVDALHEFRVLSSTYSAEYGHSPGGQFTFLTRSGTDQLHGDVFDYLRNDIFDANDWFNDHYGQGIDALRQNDFGGSLGGPIVIPKVNQGHPRSFFFVSYEGLRLTQPQAASVQLVPDQFLRDQAPAAIQSILNVFPLPTSGGIDYGNASNPSLAQFLKSYSVPSQIDSTSLRLDHTFGSKLAMFFRAAYTPSSADSRSLSSVNQVAFNTQTYTLGATSQLSRQATDDFRLGFARSDSKVLQYLDSFGGAVPVNLAAATGAGPSPSAQPVVVLEFAGAGETEISTGPSTNGLRQWNAVDTLSYVTGKHALKFGVDYRHLNSPIGTLSPQVYTFFLGASDVLNNAATETAVLELDRSTPIFQGLAAFEQDEWRLRPSLALSLGLRWQVDPPPTGADGQDAYTISGSPSDPLTLGIAPRGTPLWETPWFNFAPRLGVAWQLRNKPGWETVLRAGGGAFFDTDNQAASAGFIGVGFSASKTYFGAPLPLTPGQIDLHVSVSPPYNTVYGFPTHLQLPYTLEWNVSLEQALSRVQSFAVSYVAANGRRQLQEKELSLASVNPDFTYVLSFDGGLSSSYNALQVKFQRSLSNGVQALGSYTWAHAIDFGSTYAALYVLRGNADFDVRNTFSGALSWDLPPMSRGQVLRMLVNDWGLDGRFIARSAFPVGLLGNTAIDPANGNYYYKGVNLVPGQPTYVYGNQFPGGRTINPTAFANPSGTELGNAPRNFVRGFGEEQINLALRREFHASDRLRIQFRAEAFNLLNHPNFGHVDSILADAIFGQATKTLSQSLGTVASQYQQGGPRSLQFALKLLF
jgi:hypothetical protein